MSASWGTGVTNANPLLNSNGSLRSGSPCIDRGDLGCYPNLLLGEDLHSGPNLARDIAGKARLTGPEIDMGAQEMGVLNPVLLD